MESSQRKAKIKTAATVGRLKFLIRNFFLSSFCFLAASIILFARKSAVCITVGVISDIVGLGAAFLWIRFAAMLNSVKRDWEKYEFAHTRSAYFECFGPFLALNVTFSDKAGNVREGRTRFIFSPRDVEPWQGVPLEIGYVGEDERVILLSAAPVPMFEKNSEKDEK